MTQGRSGEKTTPHGSYVTGHGKGGGRGSSPALKQGVCTPYHVISNEDQADVAPYLYHYAPGEADDNGRERQMVDIRGAEVGRHDIPLHDVSETLVICVGRQHIPACGAH